MARLSRPWFRKGKQTWYAMVDGRQQSLGIKGREGKAEAFKAWHRLQALGKPRGPKPKADAVSVCEVLTAFLSDVASRAKVNTVRVYRYFLEPFCRQHGLQQAATLTAPQAEAWSRRADWSASTRCEALATLVAALRWAVRSRLLSSNPLNGVRKPCKASRGAKAIITLSEHERLSEAASKHFRPFLALLWATGARPGEVCGITTENADLEAGAVCCAEHKTAHKGKRRTLYLSPDAVALLRQQAALYPSGPLLRTRSGKAWDSGTAKVAMRETRARANVPHATLYGYRHSFATDALSNGVPDAMVAELLGHSGTAMLHRHYAHLSARGDVLKAALGKVR